MPSITTQHVSDIFCFAADGSIDWASKTNRSADLHSVWSIDTSMISDLYMANEWLDVKDTSPISLSPSQHPISYDDHGRRHSIEVYPPSEADPKAPLSENHKARRQAQNRAAQRAYRARKEEQIEKSRIRISELELEVQQLRRAMGSSQVSGSTHIAVLQDQLLAVETRNVTLEKEIKELKDRLRRTVTALLDSGTNVASNDGPSGSEGHTAPVK